MKRTSGCVAGGGRVADICERKSGAGYAGPFVVRYRVEQGRRAWCPSDGMGKATKELELS